MPQGSLYAYIQKMQEHMPWSDRVQLMIDICEGMEFLHSGVFADGKPKMELFHQDIKSSNVLLKMEAGVLRAKITDFGLSGISLSYAYHSAMRDAKDDGIVSHHGGTKDYLSPELCKRQGKFTKKCDVFAAGIVFLELCTLEKPRDLYEACWPRILIQKAIPDSLKLVLSQTLSEDPARRTTFSEILKILLGDRDGISLIERGKIEL